MRFSVFKMRLRPGLYTRLHGFYRPHTSSYLKRGRKKAGRETTEKEKAINWNVRERRGIISLLPGMSVR